MLGMFRPYHVNIMFALSFTKEGDIVIVGSDGVFDNLYLAAWLVDRLAVVQLVHAAHMAAW